MNVFAIRAERQRTANILAGHKHEFPALPADFSGGEVDACDGEPAETQVRENQVLPSQVDALDVEGHIGRPALLAGRGIEQVHMVWIDQQEAGIGPDQIQQIGAGGATPLADAGRGHAFENAGGDEVIAIVKFRCVVGEEEMRAWPARDIRVAGRFTALTILPFSRYSRS